MAKTAVTRKDDLRTGTPVWLKTPNITPISGPMPQRTNWDVVVVGAGISGALTAEALSRAGKRVLILDRRAAVRGSTPASTAMIQHEIDVPLSRLIHQTGKARAEGAWLRSVRAVNDLLVLTKKLRIDCDMQHKKALYLAGDDMGYHGLKAEVEARHAAGIDCRYLTGAELRDEFAIDRTAAIVSEASASANPAQLAAGLLDVAVRRGAVIVQEVEITDMAELPGGVALATENGEIVTAEFAVFCTGYEFLPVMNSNSHQITSTWALASRPKMSRPAWLDEFLVWEASDPYLYFRSTPQGRIIVGGEDENSADRNDDPALLDKKAAVIAEKLRDMIGVEIGRPAYVWAAPFGNTADGLPIIDRVPGQERSFAVMGFGGNGITFSVIAAQIIAAEIAGKPDADAPLFRFR